MRDYRSVGKHGYAGIVVPCTSNVGHESTFIDNEGVKFNLLLPQAKPTADADGWVKLMYRRYHRRKMDY
jgi:hypothetical protein